MHADAGVDDGEVQVNAFAFGRIHDDVKADLTGGGEFDGVADEIDDDLAETVAVAADHLGDTGGDVAEEFKTLFIGAKGEGLESGFEDIAEVEVDVFELGLAGFDLGEVEDVVDDAEERVCGEFDGLEVLALLWDELGLESEIGHANHAVEWGADFVAHVSEELAFGLVAGFGSTDFFAFTGHLFHELNRSLLIWSSMAWTEKRRSNTEVRKTSPRTVSVARVIQKRPRSEILTA